MSRGSETTTIGVKRDTHKKLMDLKHPHEDFDNIINRLLNRNVDVYLEFTLIDNELPQTHTAVFQLGEDSKSLYFYNGESVKPINLDEVQKLLKQPQPNMTITKEEARLLHETIEINGLEPEVGLPLWSRIKSFLGLHEVDLDNEKVALEAKK